MANGTQVTGNGSVHVRAIAVVINGLIASLLIWSLVSFAASGDVNRTVLTAFWYIPIDEVTFGMAFALAAVAHAAGWRRRWPLQVGVLVAALILPVLVFGAWIVMARS